MYVQAQRCSPLHHLFGRDPPGACELAGVAAGALSCAEPAACSVVTVKSGDRVPVESLVSRPHDRGESLVVPVSLKLFLRICFSPGGTVVAARQATEATGSLEPISRIVRPVGAYGK